MEEQKKFDKNSIIGFVLIFAIIMWFMYRNAPDEKKVAADKAKKEQLANEEKVRNASIKSAITAVDTVFQDQAQMAKLKSTLGAFAYSGTLASAKDEFTVLENSLIKIKIANKGGYISEATLKQFTKFEKGSGQLVELVNKNNAELNLKLKTSDNRVLDTKNMYFEPTLTKSGKDQILTMRLKAGEGEFLEYKYVLKPENYMLDFNIRSQGLSTLR